MIGRAKRVLEVESRGIDSMTERLDESFEKAIGILLSCRGKIIVTGMGKSGTIGRKIAATLSSTGSPAVFLHPAEGVHGDLGIMAPGDVVIAISYSGETAELSLILPSIRRLGLPIVVLTGRKDSALARAADVVLDVSVEEEACPLGLAPTASTTATLAMGDALAVVLLDERGFTEEDFAFRHPGGSLGRSLLRVSDIMQTGEALPRVPSGTTLGDAITEMTEKRLGTTTITDGEGRLIGIFTDGDVRRVLERRLPDAIERPIDEFMTRNPRTVRGDTLAVRALTEMERIKITSLVVLDSNGRPEGIIHIHDILSSKVV